MQIMSMTGFGSGKAEKDGYSVYAEIATVNRKQLEIRFSLPREFAAFENDFLVYIEICRRRQQS